MKLVCIKSYESPCGHATIKHISGNVYESIIEKNDFTIIDEYGFKYWWDEDMINEYFKSIQDIREDKLNELGL